MAQPEAHNFRLISNDLMSGFGNVGEGISLQLAKGGRRIMWMAHECAPKNFTAVGSMFSGYFVLSGAVAGTCPTIVRIG